MTDGHWQEIQDLFDACRQAQPSARRRLLADATPALRAEVEELLGFAPPTHPPGARYLPQRIVAAQGPLLIFEVLDRDADAARRMVMFRVHADHMEAARSTIATVVEHCRAGALPGLLPWLDANCDDDRIGWLVTEKPRGRTFLDWIGDPLRPSPSVSARRTVREQLAATTDALEQATGFPPGGPTPDEVWVDEHDRIECSDAGILTTFAVSPGGPNPGALARQTCAALL